MFECAAAGCYDTAAYSVEWIDDYQSEQLCPACANYLADSISRATPIGRPPRQQSNDRALALIAHALATNDWNADLWEYVANVIESTGRPYPARMDY